MATQNVREDSCSYSTVAKAQHPCDECEKPLSKNAQKRLLKQKLWETQKAERKAFKKQKEKERKLSAKLAVTQTEKANTEAEDGQPEEETENGAGALLDNSGAGPKRKREEGDSNFNKKKTKNKTKVHEQITLLIDCGFDDLMTDKEITSLSSQITRCYSDNRNARHCATMRVTSFNKRLKDRFDNSLHGQYKNWKGVQFSEEEYEVTDEDRKLENLIYLTSDSEYTLEILEKGKSYVIGGIVDRNRHKGLCYKKATQQGLKTAKLPIGEYIKMSSRFVLTTNQVVEIMLNWLECRDWKKAFLQVIPQRKQPKAKDEEVEGKGEMSDAIRDSLEGCEEDMEMNGVIIADSNGPKPSQSSESSAGAVVLESGTTTWDNNH